MKVLHLLLAGLVAVVSCGADNRPSEPDCPIGEELCPCTSGGVCNPGLTCASNICVDLSSPDASTVILDSGTINVTGGTGGNSGTYDGANRAGTGGSRAGTGGGRTGTAGSDGGEHDASASTSTDGAAADAYLEAGTNAVVCNPVGIWIWHDSGSAETFVMTITSSSIKIDDASPTIEYTLNSNTCTLRCSWIIGAAAAISVEIVFVGDVLSGQVATQFAQPCAGFDCPAPPPPSIKSIVGSRQ